MLKRIKKFVHYDYIRRQLHLFILKRRLRNKDFTLIASNCVGGAIYHDLGLKFNSPFINLKLTAKDFLKLLKNFDYYINAQLSPLYDKNVNYPLGKLNDIVIHFVHYNSFDEAKRKWDERKNRINLNNLFIIFTNREGCSKEMIYEFDRLPFENKIIFTNINDTSIRSNIYIPGFDEDECVGMVMHPIKEKPYLMYYDYFDYVKWFNKGIIKTKKIHL